MFFIYEIIISIKLLLVESNKNNNFIPKVEYVQDVIEEKLMESNFNDVAKAYILYREQRNQIRELENKMSNSLVDDYLGELDWKVRENSNMGFSLQGLNSYISSEVSKRYWLNKIYPIKIKDAHTSGDFHIHDLSLISVYCVGGI